MNRTKYDRIRQGVYRNLMIRFWRTFFIYAGGIILFAFSSYYFLHRKIWYPDDPYYPLLRWLHLNIEIVMIFLFLCGAIVICCLYFYRVARLMEEITSAVEIVYEGNTKEFLKLPDILKDVEMQLNQIMLSVRESKDKAEHLQKQKNDMIMYMAHDLKTPLTSVIGYLSLLQDEKEISEETRERYTGIALQKSFRLEELINEFFEITKTGYSEIILSRSEVNLSRMLEQILFEFKPVFREKKLTYELRAPQEVRLSLDTEQMQRVFDNLLKNICNYSYPETKVEISLERMGDRVCCIFENHGETIPPEKQAYIFEQFYRMDSARESRTGGTGLGLAIVKRIIELHHGEISCESENERIIFRILLPIS